MQLAPQENRKFPAGRHTPVQRFARAAGVSCISILLTGAPAFAQETSSATESPMGHIFRWLNFGLAIGGLAYLFKIWAAAPLRRKRTEISEQIAEGARARETADGQRREIQAKVANLQTEIEQLRIQAKRDAEAEALRLREAARGESEKIEQAARGEIAAAIRASRTELKALGARLSVQLAEAMLRQELTAQVEAKLFRSFVGQLGRNVN